MITVPEATEKIIKRSPFLEEALQQKIVNLSALARLIKREVEEETMKKVKEGAILMALKRLSIKIKSKYPSKAVFTISPDMIVRSNLIEFTLANSNFHFNKHRQLLELVEMQKNYFLTVTEGVFETTIIASQELKEKIISILKRENIISSFSHLSSITIKLPEKTATTPGVYYFILKALAWNNINIIEVVSTFTEISMILKDKEVDKAFSILKDTLSG